MPKLLLEAIGIKKSYGEKAVLDIDCLRIYDGERVALIGENGAGKTTLLKLLAGEMDADEGRIRRLCTLEYIRQSGQADHDGSARMRSELGAPEYRQGLSGGEMTRRRIAEALSGDAPLLLADEPTTDLDESGVERLKKLLDDRRGALVLISHDRSLLNALCGRVLHLEDGKLTDFPGTYSEYAEENRRRREFQQAEYDKYRSEQARLRALAQQKAEWAASVKKAPKRMGISEARLHTHEYTNSVLHLSAAKKTVEDRLARLEKKERPRDLPEIRMRLGVSKPIEAKTALSVSCEQLRAGDRVLIQNARFTLPTGSKTALLGDNGSGKSTLLRALRGEIPPGIVFAGDVRVNPAVRMGVFDQDHEKALRFEMSALENARADSTLPESEARTVLARLNLRGDDVFKSVKVLSGGERAKTALAKLLLSDINLLILDEPTNHLDLFTMESLEKLLSDYGGTLLFVSHDRAFVSAVATRVLTLKGTRLTAFEGRLDELRTENERDKSDETRRTQISALEMKLAALAARMSAPKKGDSPERLTKEYDETAEELRQLKRG